MKIIVAPNSFRDSLPAEFVSAYIIDGIRRVMPDATIIDLPLADGGDGTLSCMLRIFGGNIYSNQVQSPNGTPVNARFAVTSDKRIAIIEMAEASGARLVPVNERNPFHFSTYGTGELILAAMDLQVENIFLGIGGSGTIDGGAGALAALGVKFLDSSGVVLPPTPCGLTTLNEIDTSGLDPRLQYIHIKVLCDVHTSFKECLSRYGKQKGVKLEDAGKIQEVLLRLASLAQKRGCDILKKPWLGAGGGLAGGLVAFANASAVGGAEYLCGLAGVTSHLQHADLLITGEGRFDKGSFQGKLPLTIAKLAAQYKVATIIIAGQIIEQDVDNIPDIITLVNLAESSMNIHEMMADMPLRLSSASEKIVRKAIGETHLRLNS